MHTVRKASLLEVKRTFVTAQKMRLVRSSKKNYLSTLTSRDFLSLLQKTKNSVRKMKESQLDKIIGDEYPKRLRSYNASRWFLVTCSPKEVGVWHRAGGLPGAWTNCSLQKTAAFVKTALQNKDKRIKARAKRVLPGMINQYTTIKGSRSLAPIIFKVGTGTNGRRHSTVKCKGDIDDGCMRSIALAIAGAKSFYAYFGRM